ncbi:MAG: MarR family transcriptional regulator [Bacteroidia bacterium]
MKLEDVIKQKKFASEKQKALINIAYSSSYVSSHMNGIFKPHNISMQQFNVMRILKGQYPKAVSINDITDRMVDKMSNASRLVEKLRLKDLVERSQCSADRRQVDVQLTQAGLDLLEILNKKTKDSMTKFDHISEEDFRILNDILDRMRDN